MFQQKYEPPPDNTSKGVDHQVVNHHFFKKKGGIMKLKRVFTKEDIIQIHTVFFKCGVIAKQFYFKDAPHLLYWATSDGKVFNHSGYEMKQFDSGAGYAMVKIGGVKITVHRLIGLLFLRNDEGKLTVDHIDRNKRNNHISNLRWATYSEQAINRRQRTDSNPVRLINKHTTIYFKSIKDASRFLERNQITIKRAIANQYQLNGYMIK